MKRVLTTGVTGYIGSNLARALLADSEVYGLVRRPLHTEYIADIQDKLHLLEFDGSYESMEAAVKEACPKVVYHLATYYTGAHSSTETPKLAESNIIMGSYLLEAMSACHVPALVYTSTVMAHFKGEAYRPLNLYAATKQAFSDLLAYYTDVGLLRAVTLVLTDTYGPGDHRPKVLNLIRAAAQSGEILELSDGGQDYDAVYIDDVVQALRLAGTQLLGEQWRNETFQVIPKQPLTLRETVDLMVQVNHLTLHAAWGKRPTLGRGIRKAIRCYPTLPGWEPETSLEDGLKRLLN